jgi:acetyl esterase/lipase
MKLNQPLLILVFVALWNIVYPQRREDASFIKVSDVKYALFANADPELNSLNVYMPKRGSNSPILIWIHGGSWTYGDKEEVHSKAEYFTSKGYVFVSVNYRLSPKVKHPVHVQDVANAIVWVYQNAKHYSADQKKIFLMGHSAGAHLASLVSINNEYLKLAGGSTELIKGIVLIDGMGYDIPAAMVDASNQLKGWYVQAFGNSRWEWGLGSPVNFINTNEHIPPVLILHSGEREVAEVEAKILYAKLVDVKVPCQIMHYPKKNQTSLNKELGKPDDKPTEEVLRFLQERISAINKAR